MIESELRIIKNNIINSTDEILPDNGLKKFLSGKSKFIRSKLALLGLKAYSKDISEDIYSVLTAGEIIHNASLLHDDVIDEAKIRRGCSTICNNFSSKISVLCGDYLVSAAVTKLLSINNDYIANAFLKCVSNMAKAEVKQYFLRGKIADEKTYLSICEGKTAELFGTILESVAVLSDLNRTNMKKFGKLFGLCFQIKNDLSENSVIEDIRNEVYTAKDVMGLEKAKSLSDNYKKEMKLLLTEVPDNKYKKELEGLIDSL